MNRYGIRIFFKTTYLADTSLNSSITIYNEIKIFGKKLDENELLISNDINYHKRTLISFLQKFERFCHVKKTFNRIESNYVDSPRGYIDFYNNNVKILFSQRNENKKKGEIGESLEYFLTNGNIYLIDNLFNCRDNTFNFKKIFDINLMLEQNNENLIKNLNLIPIIKEEENKSEDSNKSQNNEDNNNKDDIFENNDININNRKLRLYKGIKIEEDQKEEDQKEDQKEEKKEEKIEIDNKKDFDEYNEESKREENKESENNQKDKEDDKNEGIKEEVKGQNKNEQNEEYKNEVESKEEKKEQSIKEEKNKVNNKEVNNIIIKDKEENNKKTNNKEKNKGITKQEVDYLCKYMNDPVYQRYFLIKLNNYRTLGIFEMPLVIFNYINQIFSEILKHVEKEKKYEKKENIFDIENTKIVIILSQTFYCIKEEQKIYLQKELRKEKLFKNPTFWKIILEISIENELKNYIYYCNKKNGESESEEAMKEKKTSIAFAQMLPYINSMSEFGVNINDIKSIVDPFIKEYEISEENQKVMFGIIKE